MSNISAVICVKNAELTLERTLDSLFLNNPYEILIIDGDSTDNSSEIAKEYTDKIFSDKGNGLGFARQLGAEKATGNYIAYIDSDTELPNANMLSEMLKELKNRNWVAIHAQIIDPRKDKGYWEEGENFHWVNTFNKPGEKKHLGTIVCIIKREILLKYKFDSSFEGAAEDADFYARLLKDGNKFGISKLTAYHYHRATFNDFKKQRIWYGKGNAHALIKHQAFILLFSPIMIFVYGTWKSVISKRVKFIPFYGVWMFYLAIGTFKGIIER